MGLIIPEALPGPALFSRPDQSPRRFQPQSVNLTTINKPRTFVY